MIFVQSLCTLTYNFLNLICRYRKPLKYHHCISITKTICMYSLHKHYSLFIIASLSSVILMRFSYFFSRINYDVACPMNFEKYPYDTQTCKVKYESCKYHIAQKLLLIFIHNPYAMEKSQNPARLRPFQLTITKEKCQFFLNELRKEKKWKVGKEDYHVRGEVDYFFLMYLHYEYWYSISHFLQNV